MTKLRELGGNALLAVGLALGLWVFVSLTTNPDDRETFNNIPTQVRGLTEGLVIVDQNGLPRADQNSLEAVNITIQADRATLTDVSQSDIISYVDLTGLEPGTHRASVEVQLPRNNITVVTTVPEAIPIRIERVTRTEVPISVEIEGSPPFSYERGDPEVTINSRKVENATIAGPENLIERVVSVGTTVNIDQLQTTSVSTRELRAFDANDELVEGVTIAPPEVQVRIPIRAAVGLKRVPVLGTVTGSPAFGYIITAIESDPQLVTIVGGSDILAQIDRIETEPVDISGATSTVTSTVNLRLRGAQLQAGDPDQATVTITINRLDQPFDSTVQIPVQVTGVAPGLLVTITPRNLDVMLRGRTEVFFQQGLLESLVATVDMSGDDAGTYTREPQINLPPELTIAGDPPTVTVELRFPPTPTLVPTSAPTATPQGQRPTPPNGANGANGANEPNTPRPTSTDPAATPTDEQAPAATPTRPAPTRPVATPTRPAASPVQSPTADDGVATEPTTAPIAREPSAPEETPELPAPPSAPPAPLVPTATPLPAAPTTPTAP